MLDSYLRVLGLMTANSDGMISSVSLTSDEEIEQLSASFAASLDF
jgi:hypothetical protein